MRTHRYFKALCENISKWYRSKKIGRQSEDLVYAELLNQIRIGNHNSDDLEVVLKQVYGTGNLFDHECAVTENATVLCSKHEYRDVINKQLSSTLPSEVIDSHSDCSGAPLKKFQTTKLNKSAPLQVLKAKVWCSSSDYQKFRCGGGVVNGIMKIPYFHAIKRMHIYLHGKKTCA